MLLRGANDYMLDEMDRSLHDALCIVKVRRPRARSRPLRPAPTLTGSSGPFWVLGRKRREQRCLASSFSCSFSGSSGGVTRGAPLA